MEYQYTIELPEDVQTLADALIERGYHPYLVGGAVRDAVEYRTPKDWDLELFGCDTLGKLSQVVKELGWDCDLVGAAFGVVIVKAPTMDIEIAFPRSERRIGDSHTSFEITIQSDMNIKDAQARRDLTINAIYYDIEHHTIIDNFDGMIDLREGFIRHTSKLFTEDALRVLRVAQFAARFDFDVDGGTLALCNKMVHMFDGISQERLFIEFEKALSKSVKPSIFFRVLDECGWLTQFQELYCLQFIEQDPEWHPEGNVWQHTMHVLDAMSEICQRENVTGEDRVVLLLAALCHDLGKAVTTTTNESGRIISPDHASQGVPIANEFLQSIGCYPRIIERVLPLVAEHMAHLGITEPSRRVVARLARRLDKATIHEWSMIVEADHSGRPPLTKCNPVKHWVALAEAIDVGNGAMKPIIMGRHLIQLGLKPSKEFGAILSAAMDAQENGDFTDEVHGLKWLREFISKGVE